MYAPALFGGTALFLIARRVARVACANRSLIRASQLLRLFTKSDIPKKASGLQSIPDGSTLQRILRSRDRFFESGRKIHAGRLVHGVLKPLIENAIQQVLKLW